MINALFDLLGTCYQAGDFAQAEAIARGIMRTIPDDTVAMQFLGLVYYRTRRFGDAIRVFSATCAGGVQAAGRHDAASLASAQCLPAASRRGSALADAWYDLGLVLFRLRRFPQAIRALKAAVSARPDFHAARRAMVRIGRFAGRSAALPERLR